ncbi:MAG: hypothetical protein ACR2MG_10995 [Pyrinomonadaceae bacterium]
MFCPNCSQENLNEATEKDKFKFDTAGVIIEFNTEKKQLTLKQGGQQFLFAKDK